MSEIREAEIPTRGMHCRSCETLVELTVGEMEGVRSVEASAGDGLTRVAYDPEAVSIAEIVEAICGVGYDARSPEDEA
ncbi:MAG: heavy metal-associated domain-containing protein [Anaerosomatales bacterium]|nr:heavy metal-associated domain-containing protein [Anaerosomatales bacterium]